MNGKIVRSGADLQPLRELAARIGSDPLLTQASTGNASIKLHPTLWIKASGTYMARALEEEILTPLDLAEVNRCIEENVDPAERYSHASIETAMHAVMPHRVVVHVHCVDTIAWAVRQDAPLQLKRQLSGLRWRWVPYVRSGLPLGTEIRRLLSASGAADVFVLSNHGLVVGGDDCGMIENLLSEVRRRLAVHPRRAPGAHYGALARIADVLSWDLPEDDAVHALGTDPISQSIVSGGLFYTSQITLGNSNSRALFRPVPCPAYQGSWANQYRRRPFLIIAGRGVIINRTLKSAERSTMSGLAQVVQRISAAPSVRYLTEAEIRSRCAAHNKQASDNAGGPN